MALLQEATRVLAVPASSLTESLEENAQGSQAATHMAQSVVDVGDSVSHVCGTWAAEQLLPRWEKQSSLKTPRDRNATRMMRLCLVSLLPA